MRNNNQKILIELENLLQSNKFLACWDKNYFYESLITKEEVSDLVSQLERDSYEIPFVSFLNNDEPLKVELKELALGLREIKKNSAELNCQAVIRNADINSKISEKLSDLFRKTLNAYTNAHLFISNSAGATFVPHWDDHAVFILQLEGRKNVVLYDFIETAVVTGQKGHFVPGEHLENAKLFENVLEPGDFLYIPRGMPHYLESNGCSLSVSIGVFSFTNFDLVKSTLNEISNSQIYFDEFRELFAPGSEEKVISRFNDIFSNIYREKSIMVDQIQRYLGNKILVDDLFKFKPVMWDYFWNNSANSFEFRFLLDTVKSYESILVTAQELECLQNIIYGNKVNLEKRFAQELLRLGILEQGLE